MNVFNTIISFQIAILILIADRTNSFDLQAPVKYGDSYSLKPGLLDSLRESSNERDLRHSDDNDYDIHGCCLTCGEVFCPTSNTCVDDWDDCKLGKSFGDDCKYVYNNTLDSFTYQLSSLAASIGDYYLISDELSHTNELFRYYFNFCRNVNPTNLPSVCSETYGAANDKCSGSALAYQYSSSSSGEKCYRMTDCNALHHDSRIELGLLDPVKPASGVYVKYYGGNTCENSYADKEACSHVITKHTKNTTYCARTFQ